jgi:hypothetical protein
VSFSNVKYVDIAPKVGLDPLLEGQDIAAFPMYRARLTNDIFKQILQNIEDFSMQYGHMGSHKNEEARSRFLSAVRLSSSFGRSADINVYIVF